MRPSKIKKNKNEHELEENTFRHFSFRIEL